MRDHRPDRASSHTCANSNPNAKTDIHAHAGRCSHRHTFSSHGYAGRSPHRHSGASDADAI